MGEIIASRFEIVALADWGGMGAVYRARDRHSGGEVALKLLLDESSEERFAREARVLADLRHPGIVQYVAHGKTAAGSLYLAMEWLDGNDLRARLATGPLSLRDALALVRGAARGAGAWRTRAASSTATSSRGTSSSWAATSSTCGCSTSASRVRCAPPSG